GCTKRRQISERGPSEARERPGGRSRARLPHEELDLDVPAGRHHDVVLAVVRQDRAGLGGARVERERPLRRHLRELEADAAAVVQGLRGAGCGGVARDRGVVRRQRAVEQRAAGGGGGVEDEELEERVGAEGIEREADARVVHVHAGAAAGGERHEQERGQASAHGAPFTTTVALPVFGASWNTAPTTTTAAMATPAMAPPTATGTSGKPSP